MVCVCCVLAAWVRLSILTANLRCHRPSSQLILAFTSNWTPTGGVPEYLEWAGSDQQVGRQVQGRAEGCRQLRDGHWATTRICPRLPPLLALCTGAQAKAAAAAQRRQRSARPSHPAAPPTPQVDFFTSPAIKQMFKGWVETLVSRVNTINGRTYRDDPTIMAWVRQLVGVPGMQSTPGQAWKMAGCGACRLAF